MSCKPEPLTLKRVDNFVSPSSLVHRLALIHKDDTQMPRTLSLLQNPTIQKIMHQKYGSGSSKTSAGLRSRCIIQGSPYRNKTQKEIVEGNIDSKAEVNIKEDLKKTKEEKAVDRTIRDKDPSVMRNKNTTETVTRRSMEKQVTIPTFKEFKAMQNAKDKSDKNMDIINKNQSNRTLEYNESKLSNKTMPVDNNANCSSTEESQLKSSNRLVDVTNEYLCRLREKRNSLQSTDSEEQKESEESTDMEETDLRESVDEEIENVFKRVEDIMMESDIPRDYDLQIAVDKQLDDLFKPLESMITEEKENVSDSKQYEKSSLSEEITSNANSEESACVQNINDIFREVEKLCDDLKPSEISDTTKSVKEKELCARLHKLIYDECGTMFVGYKAQYHTSKKTGEMQQFAKQLLTDFKDCHFPQKQTNTALNSKQSWNSSQETPKVKLYIGNPKSHLLSDSSSITSDSTLDQDLEDVCSINTESTLDVFEPAEDFSPHSSLASPTSTIASSSSSYQQDEGYSTPRDSVQETLFNGRMEVFRRISREERDNFQDVEEHGNLIRSTSDVSEMFQEETRRRQVREKRQKLHLSDPLEMRRKAPGITKSRNVNTAKSMKDTMDETEEIQIGSSFSTANNSDEEDSPKTESPKMLAIPKSVCGSSKEEILHFLEKAKRKLSDVHAPFPAHQSPETESAPSSLPDSPSLSRLSSSTSLSSCCSDPNTEGVTDFTLPWLPEEGSSLYHTKAQLLSMKQCTDCGKILASGSSADKDSPLCSKCKSKRNERKNIVKEILDTEVSYGKDLSIIKEEFYTPLKTAGLLNADQLQSVFINLKELIHVNYNFMSHLSEAVAKAINEGDETLTMVPVGQIFLDSSTMFLAFENYVVHQSAAPMLLEQLEKEKELLKIFLQVSTKENSVLRRMDLKAFLMIPVQRVMKYPLFLGRLYKLTPSHHPDKDSIKRAQHKLQGVLDHINSKTKNSSTGSFRRKVSFRSLTKSPSTTSIEITKLAIESVGWLQADTRIVYSARLLYNVPVPQEHNWSRRTHSYKYSQAYGLLLAREKIELKHKFGHLGLDPSSGKLLFPATTSVQEAAFVLVKEKSAKYTLIREPFSLDCTIVSVNPEKPSVIDLQDLFGDMYIIKGSDQKETQIWLNHLKQMSVNLSRWRRRRNALPNIMIPHNKHEN